MRTVKVVPVALAALTLVAALCASGCFSRRYPGLVERHLEVLGLYADKIEALAQDEQTVPAQDWGEFTYPLERARELVRIAESRDPDRASLPAFRQAVDAYAALVEDPALLSAPDAAAVVGERVGRFRVAADAVRAALASER